MTVVFQSNQNDRVTSQRHREDVFLASHSPRESQFNSDFIPALQHIAWLPGFFRDVCLQNRAQERI